MPFVIRFKIKNTTYDIQTVLDDNETTMNQTFQKCMIYWNKIIIKLLNFLIEKWYIHINLIYIFNKCNSIWAYV